jgi:DNA recombination protein RmuC
VDGPSIFEIIVVILLLGNLVALLVAAIWLSRRATSDPAPMLSALQQQSDEIEKIEKALLSQVSQLREDSQRQDSILRQEIQTLFGKFGESTGQRMSEIANLQKNQLDGFAKQLHENLQTSHTASDTLRQTLNDKQDSLRNSLIQQLAEQRETSAKAFQTMQDRIGTQLESKLTQLREENTAKLEEMRVTVDEKLQGTLEKRLGESFKIVSDRLEQVHRGLGEMQTLANGVGDLKRVLTNVKTRGTWGEYQLQALLEEMLIPEQYEANARVRPGSKEHVEFAIRMPGRDDDGGYLLLPIDAKFPKEDYERLLDAQEAADAVAAEQAGKQLENGIKKSARDIATKYIVPPHTTDFAIMFLPSEGLFAEVVRRPGLADTVRREFNVMLAGPTTFTSVLSSLQMGFRTLAIEKRSSEVWRLLSDVKSEFGKFGGALDKVKKKLQEAANQVEGVETRTRVMTRKLKNVEDTLPEDTLPEDTLPDEALLPDDTDSKVVELPISDGSERG